MTPVHGIIGDRVEWGIEYGLAWRVAGAVHHSVKWDLDRAMIIRVQLPEAIESISNAAGSHIPFRRGMP
jgi:hypothetical protein